MIKKLLFLFLVSNFCFAQSSLKNTSKTINLSVSETKEMTFEVKKDDVLNQDFEIKNIYQEDTSIFFDIGHGEIAYLIEKQNNKEVIIGKCGRRVPLFSRSVKDDYRVLAIRLQANETKKVTLRLKNFYDNAKINVSVLNYGNYQVLKSQRNDNFYIKYWNPGYLSVLILFLILAIIQYFVLPEGVIIYYIFYLVFTFIRSAAYIEILVLEEWIPILNEIHYSSLNSQVFTYVSFIFYVLFLREFTGFAIKKPHLDFFFKIQIGYLVCFVIFDVVFPNEKYSNPQINSIFRFLETAGLVLGLINLVLLFKVYDNFNKFVLWGAVALFTVGIFGQEIIKRASGLESNPEEFSLYLSFIWSIAYLVEIIFFAAALLSRQRLLLDTIKIERERNFQSENFVKTPIENFELEPTHDFESFSLATNKGILVFRQADIVRLEASGSYTIFSIQNQNPVLASYTLSDFEKKLNPAKFIRVHKSHIVNLDYIVKYTKGDGGVLTLSTGTEIPVSRSRKEELLEKLPTVK